jgi:hypothetical protein
MTGAVEIGRNGKWKMEKWLFFNEENPSALPSSLLTTSSLL